MDIRAAIHRKPGAPLSIETIQIDDPLADEICVELAGTGVCHTDYAFAEHPDLLPTPIVLGHEGAGTVVSVGSSVTEFSPGDRVVMSIDSCGGCASCLRGSPAYCDEMAQRHFTGGRMDGSSPLHQSGTRINGMFFAQSSFASHAVAPARAAVAVPDCVPLEMLGPLACGIQTGAGTVLNIFKPDLGASIAVFGVGSVGLSAIMAARIADAGEIIAVDVVDSRLELAMSMGATHAINPQHEDPVEAIVRHTGRGADYAFDNTGNPTVIRQAFDALGSKGELAIANARDELTFDGYSILIGKKIRGVLEGDSVPKRFIPQLIELHRQGRLPFDRMVTYYDFDQINQAIEDSRSGKVIKPILRF